MRYMNVKQIAQKANCTERHIYYLASVLGHLPTVEEVLSYQPKRRVGRPNVYLAEYIVENTEEE